MGEGRDEEDLEADDLSRIVLVERQGTLLSSGLHRWRTNQLWTGRFQRRQYSPRSLQFHQSCLSGSYLIKLSVCEVGKFGEDVEEGLEAGVEHEYPDDGVGECELEDLASVGAYVFELEKELAVVGVLAVVVVHDGHHVLSHDEAG